MKLFPVVAICIKLQENPGLSSSSITIPNISPMPEHFSDDGFSEALKVNN